MTPTIRVMIADDVAATRENIRKLLIFHADIEVVGEAANGREAIEQAKKLKPHIVLMDINMPEIDGITASKTISLEAPDSHIIIMSVQGEQEYLRRAMMAGAKDYLVKPFTGDELVQAVRSLYQMEQQKKQHSGMPPQETQGKVVSVFSSKGGVGKTTIASNLAVSLAQKTGARVAIVDADLQFGDVALFLNVIPHATVVDLIQDIDNLDDKTIAQYVLPHDSGVKILAAPTRPEQAEMITGQHMTTILKVLKQHFDYIVVDTTPTFQETVLSVLDMSDQILLVSALDLPTIKNIKLCLEIMDSLHYSKDKVKLVLNRATSDTGMDLREVEETLAYPFIAHLPSDGKVVVTSVNRGIPFVISNPETTVAQSIVAIAKQIATGDWQDSDKPKSMVYRLIKMFG